MDKQSRELSAQLLAIESHYTSPTYLEIREKLMGRLASSSMYLEDVREETSQRRSNSNFLRKFGALLPQPEVQTNDWGHEFVRFLVDTPYEARLLQSLAIWSNTNPRAMSSWVEGSPNSNHRAFYVIGKHVDLEDPKYTDILLFSDQAPGSGVRQIRTRSNDLHGYTEASQTLLVTEPDINEVQELYNVRLDKLVINASSPHVFHTDTGTWSSYGLRRQKENELRYDRTADSTLDSSAPLYAVGPTDIDIANFGVPEHLNRLAVAFGQAKAYDRLLHAA